MAKDDIRIKRVRLDSLHLDPANPRAHPDENLEAIRASLRQFGQVEPLVIHKSTGKIIGGNGRYTVMKEEGWEECDIFEFDGSDAQAIALGIALNRTAETATWDKETLAKLMKGIRDTNPELESATGFDKESVSQMLIDFNLAENTGSDADLVPEPPDDPKTQKGDLWILGNHRLLCGDSSSKEDVDRLLGGQWIQLVNTDPPYNVKVEPRSNNAIAAGLSSFPAPSKRNQKFQTNKAGLLHHQGFDVARQGKKKPTGKMRPKDRPLANDYISDEDFAKRLLEWFGHMARVLKPGRAFYIWGGYANVANYPPALKECELYFSQAIIWVKEHPVLTRKDFMGNHEWCFYGWREGAAHQFYGPKNVPDVWPVKKINPASMIHLTEKPVELAARAITYSTRVGENVLDLFGGSGSTLIAAEQNQRKAFLMELDPAYCDVIVERWEKFAKRTATCQHPG